MRGIKKKKLTQKGRVELNACLGNVYFGSNYLSSNGYLINSCFSSSFSINVKAYLL
ncbi:hypothetical protein SAMN04488491_1950 [Psychrobacter sp. LV10R520-6]|nr:hypothetical protein SAMN04488491_1950 [Psychrobacter sp. LV10R520-6]